MFAGSAFEIPEPDPTLWVGVKDSNGPVQSKVIVTVTITDSNEKTTTEDLQSSNGIVSRKMQDKEMPATITYSAKRVGATKGSPKYIIEASELEESLKDLNEAIVPDLPTLKVSVKKSNGRMSGYTNVNFKIVDAVHNKTIVIKSTGRSGVAKLSLVNVKLPAQITYSSEKGRGSRKVKSEVMEVTVSEVTDLDVILTLTLLPSSTKTSG